jgi:uncharacterized protein (UPF0332 family)
MRDDKIKSLAVYRLDKAKETYLTAVENLNNAKYLDANNRAYYSVFHAIRAVLALDEVDFKKHSGVISYFRENYIKTKLFDDKYSRIVSKASIIRGKSDYEDFYVTSKNEAQEQVDNAKIFYDAIAAFISNIIEE